MKCRVVFPLIYLMCIVEAAGAEPNLGRFSEEVLGFEFDCNMNSLRNNSKLHYHFLTPAAGVLSEASFDRDGSTLQHASKKRPVWLTTVERNRGQSYFIVRSLKAPRFKFVMLDQITKASRGESYSKGGKAVLWDENIGPIAEGECDILID